MTSADRTKIIEALKNNPNAAAVARQFGFGEGTILRLCKKEGIALQHLLTEAKRTEVVELLKSNLNALITAKQLGLNHKTVCAVAKKEGINIKAMRQAAKGRRTLPFTQWARSVGGKPLLQCAVYLADGSRLSPSLNTSDTEVEAPQRMRLILWHAIAEGQLPSGVNHPAWRLYGGSIPESTKRLLRRLRDLPWAEYELQREAAATRLGLYVKTIDRLTNQDKARPVRPSAQRYLARKAGQRIPVTRYAWQFLRGGRLWFEHPDGGFNLQFTISRRTFRWRLKVSDREEANAIVEPVYLARSRVHEAADQWRNCAIGTSESANASAALLEAQRRYLEALVGAGAHRDKDWPELAKLMQELPYDEPRKALRAQPEGPEQKCTRWWVKLLRLHPDHPPPGRSVRKLIEEARKLHGVSERGARGAYQFAQKETGNHNWPKTRRPRTISS